MARSWCIFGLLLWIGGVAAVAILMHRDVVAEAVELRLEDGTPIHGTLYRPNNDHKDLAIAVVAHGTAVTHQSCVPGFAIPLAREDFLTLAIDLRGHGRSGGALPRQALEGDPTTVSPDDYPEIDAAINFLKHHPLYIKHHPSVPTKCCVLIGHSRGGLAVASAGYQRADVDGVVSIGVAPQTCDAERPRNFMILTGASDLLYPKSTCLEAMRKATGGGVQSTYEMTGSHGLGTARQMQLVGNINHLTELANPTVTRQVVQWSCNSAFFHYDPIPEWWLPSLIGAVLTALAGGLLACIGISSRLAGAWLGERGGLGLRARNGKPAFRLVLFIAVLAALVPAIAAAERWLEVGPVYFAGPCVVVLAGAAVVALVLASRERQRPEPRAAQTPVANAPGSPSRGLLVGLATLLLTFAWIGFPWGQTWADLAPTPRRLVLGVALFALLFPSSLGLASGIQRLAGRSRFAPALLWLAFPLTLWASQMLFTSRRWPMFAIPIALLAAGFLVSSPLWFVPHRRGLSLARAVTHAGATAWLVACHVPFVD